MIHDEKIVQLGAIFPHIEENIEIDNQSHGKPKYTVQSTKLRNSNLFFWRYAIHWQPHLKKYLEENKFMFDAQEQQIERIKN